MKKHRGYRFKFVTGLSVALLLIGTVGSASVQAEEVQESITLSPPTKHLTVDAGAVVRDEFTIINYGDTAYDFQVYTGPYSVKDEAYTPDFTSQPANADAYRWISFEKATWHAEPKQTIHIPFTMNVSKGATAGGHYGVIFVETQPKTAESTGISRKKRLALLLYSTVNGPTETSGKVASIDTPWFTSVPPLTSTIEATVNGPTETSGKVASIDTPWFTSVPPLTSTIRIENTGKTDFAAKTRFAVMDLFGNVKYQNEQEAYVLPNTTRAVDISWDKTAWIGVYKVHSEATVLGKHTQSDQYVVVAPKWLLFILALLGLLGAIEIVRRRNNGSTTAFRPRR